MDGVQRLYLCPDGLGDCPASHFCVTVRNAANQPINNALVEVIIDGLDDQRVMLCSDQQMTAYTNAAGTVCFNIAGGGCYKNETNAFHIRANGVVIRSFEAVMSSDYMGVGDDGQAGMWDLHVNAQDFASFIAAYQGGAGPASCHDYDNNGATDPPDFAVFIVAYRGGANFCDPWW